MCNYYLVEWYESLVYSGPPRFDGDRPRFGDREGYRAGPRGPPGEFGGEKGGAPADYQPSFGVSKSITSIGALLFKMCRLPLHVFHELFLYGTDICD